MWQKYQTKDTESYNSLSEGTLKTIEFVHLPPFQAGGSVFEPHGIHPWYPPKLKDCRKWFPCSRISSTTASNLCLLINTRSSPFCLPKYYIAGFQNCIGFHEPVIPSLPLRLSRCCPLSLYHLMILSHYPRDSLHLGVSVSLLPASLFLIPTSHTMPRRVASPVCFKNISSPLWAHTYTTKL